ncbi:glycoside hydrolase superfamily [Mucor lusitanicus]
MRFTSIITVALSFAGLVKALPIESRGVSSLNGVTYTARNSDGSCQSASQIVSSVKLMKSSGVSKIRTYAQECESLPNILKAIKEVGGMTVLPGVWIDGTSNDDAEIARLQKVLNSADNTNAITGILVGNEVIFNNIMSSSQLVGKLNQVKKIAKGIQVGTAEVDSTYTSDLMAASDFAGVNIHPYFASASIKNAFSNLNQRYNTFKKSAGGKQVYITETGWPSSGAASGAAQPSLANTEAFVTSLSASSLPYYYFEWEDSNWKGAGVESHFGLLNVVRAQLGPAILSPEQNATVPVGGKVDIVYRYQNMGTGNYSVDIQLWQDAAVTIPISNITIDHEIKGGNSSGVKVNFLMNDTFTWSVPHGLNRTFWLTVTEKAETAFYTKGISLRSRPVMLHPSSAIMNSPASYAILSTLAICTIVFSLL